MNKQEFLEDLRRRLAGLPSQEIEKSVSYFSEMLDDRIEDGMTEEEAVGTMEDLDEIVEQIFCDTPLPKLIKGRMEPRRRWTIVGIVLVILGSPIWLSLLIAAAAVLLSVYIVVWAVIISLFAVVVSFVLSGLLALVLVPLHAASGLAGCLFLIGSGLVLLGLGVLLFFPILEVSRQLVRFTGWLLRKIKSLFIRKEAR